ncbi:MAG: HU family DNA-binding protein [Candidatus Obscuribacterales bacterium]
MPPRFTGGRPSAFKAKQVALELHELLDIPLENKQPKKGRLIINTIVKCMVDALKRGESVEIPGFGRFQVVERTGNGRCLVAVDKTGKILALDSKPSRIVKKRVQFKPSDVWITMINLNDPDSFTYIDKRNIKIWKAHAEKLRRKNEN